jgi:hypothetical protein
MKALVFALLAVSTSTTRAQVTECPRFYPWQDTRLAEVPPQHKGTGVLTKSRLASAAMYAGELGGQAELQGDRQKVKGGWDVLYGFARGDARWLVCSYGAQITWWEQMDPKATSCKLEVRDGGRNPASAKVSCT